MTILILDADAILVRGSGASLDVGQEGGCLNDSNYIFTRKMPDGFETGKSFPFDLELTGHVGDNFELTEEVAY